MEPQLADMLEHHEAELARRIDAVAWGGVAHIHWWELKSWYQADDFDAVANDVWRDIDARFREVIEDQRFELFVYAGDGGITLVHSDGLMRLRDKFGAGIATSTRPTSVPVTRT